MAELILGHLRKCRAVDRCYRRDPFPNDRARVEHLFTLYEQLTAPLAVTPPVGAVARLRKALDSRPPPNPSFWRTSLLCPVGAFAKVRQAPGFPKNSWARRQWRAQPSTVNCVIADIQRGRDEDAARAGENQDGSCTASFGQGSLAESAIDLHARHASLKAFEATIPSRRYVVAGCVGPGVALRSRLRRGPVDLDREAGPFFSSKRMPVSASASAVALSWSWRLTRRLMKLGLAHGHS